MPGTSVIFANGVMPGRSIQFRCKRKKPGFHVFNNGILVWQEQDTEATDREPNDHKRKATTEDVRDPSSIPSGASAQPFFTTLAEDDGQQEQNNATKRGYISKKIQVSSQWSIVREQLVAQLIKNATPATFLCCMCKDAEPVETIIRCLDCGPRAYFCKTCCNQHHRMVYLHLPEIWDPVDRCFKDCNNKLIWKRPNNHQCETSKLTPVVIIDDKGRQHQQVLESCQCQPLPVLMMEYSLWPASPSNPRVAFTLDFMLTLRSIVLEGHVSLHAFCTAIQQCRPGLYRDKESEWIKDIYRVLNWETVLNFMSVYHNISHMQFANIGLPDGSVCQVCPEVGDSEGRRMTMDGNMNLVHRAKAGHSIRDPIHQGRFFLPQDEVDQFLSEQGHLTKPPDQSCSNFQAGSVIRSKNKTEKLDVTGVFASICSHDFPCYIFNLRHGERMAYPIFMMKSMENVKILMYDLGCQLETVVRNRQIASEVTFGVPIFHVYGHKMSCQVIYSPRAILGAGLFDGEGSERLWSYLGKFRIITKEMTPENRVDLLVEGLLNYGHKINSKLGLILSQRLARALMLRDSTARAVEQDLLLFPGVTEATVEQWDTDEKELAAAPPKKNQAESWEATYAMGLHNLYTKSAHMQLGDEDILGEEVASVEAAVRRLEKRNKVKRRWLQTSNLYKRHLQIGCEGERFIKLAQVRDAVVQYSFMVYMKTKYARGQSLAIRITKQILATSRKVNLALQAYNKVPPFGDILPHKLQRSDVSSLDADVWQHLAPNHTDGSGVPPLIQRKLIDMSRLNKRAKEEVEMTKRDMDRLVRSFTRQVDILSAEVVRLDQKDSLSALEKGNLALLVRRLHEILSCQKAVSSILTKATSPESVNVQEFVDEVESKLNDVTQTDKVELSAVSDEGVKEMLEGIKMLEDDNDHDMEDLFD